MTQPEPTKAKHGGCADCGSKDQVILTSILLKGESMGKALCDPCIEKRREKGEIATWR